MRPPVALLSLAGCALLGSVSAARVVAAADPLADLARLGGTWVRNADMSDDRSDAGTSHRLHPPFIGPATPGGPRSGPGMGGPLVAGPVTGGRGDHSQADPGDVERTKALMRLATDLPDQMAISVDGTAVTITSYGGRVLHLRADGQKTVGVSDVGLEVERRTKWDDGALVTEFKAKGGGGEGKQVYKRDGARLVVQVTFDGDAALRTIKMKQVYDLAKE